MRAKRATSKAARPLTKADVKEALMDAIEELAAARAAQASLGEGTVQTAPPPESAPAAKGWQIPVLPYLRNMVRTDNHMRDVGDV